MTDFIVLSFITSVLLGVSGCTIHSRPADVQPTRHLCLALAKTLPRLFAFTADHSHIVPPCNSVSTMHTCIYQNAGENHPINTSAVPNRCSYPCPSNITAAKGKIHTYCLIKYQKIVKKQSFSDIYISLAPHKCKLAQITIVFTWFSIPYMCGVVSVGTSQEGLLKKLLDTHPRLCTPDLDFRQGGAVSPAQN